MTTTARVRSWAASAIARITQTPGMPPGLIASLPRGSKRMLYAAVFFMFSSVGFIADIMKQEVEPPRIVVLIAAITGLTAVLFVYVVTHHPRWSPALIAAQLLLVFPGVSLLENGVPLEDVTPDVLRAKLLLDAIGCLMGFVLSYLAFMRFIGAEGTRYARAYAEIELAREIHQLLVPTVARSEGRYEFYGVSMASTEVGGDLVDVMTLDPGWIGYVADVSGHGVGSGLLMGIVKSAIRTRVMRGGAVGDVLTDVNRVLVPLRKPNMYVTLAALQEDGAGGLTFSVAGHPPILHYRVATNAIEELTIPHVPLGFFDDRVFADATVTPDAGDLFVIVTDGLTEVFDGQDNEFGLERLKSVIRACPHQPLKAIADTVLQQVRRHGPQADDQTLLLVRAG